MFAFPPGPRALLRAIADASARRTRARRAVRRRPRALRARGAARARRAARPGRRDAARQRPLRPPLAAASRARRCRSPRCPPPSRARSAATCPGAGTSGGSPCCRSGSRSSASGRSRARRRARASASTPPARTCCSRTTPRGRSSASTARGRRPATCRCSRSGGVAPDEVPYWINAANAVLVPSQDEGFGLSVIEALACGVPAFGTPVGIHPVALDGIDGAFCAEWDAARWRAALRPRARGRRPARRRPRAGRAVLRRPDGRPRRRGVARASSREHGGREAERRSARLYSALRAHRRPRSATDHERTPATHQALARRRRRRAPPGGPGRRAGGRGPRDRPATGATAPASADAPAPPAAGPRSRTREDRSRCVADPDVPAGVDPAAALVAPARRPPRPAAAPRCATCAARAS